MEIKLVENVKEVPCDVLIINKFEGKETTCDLANKFLPENFKGKKRRNFCFSHHIENSLQNIFWFSVLEKKKI